MHKIVIMEGLTDDKKAGIMAEIAMMTKEQRMDVLIEVKALAYQFEKETGINLEDYRE